MGFVFRRGPCHYSPLECGSRSPFPAGVPWWADPVPKTRSVLHIFQNLLSVLPVLRWARTEPWVIQPGSSHATHPQPGPVDAVHIPGTTQSGFPPQTNYGHEDWQHPPVESKWISHVLPAAGWCCGTESWRRPLRQRLQCLDAGPWGRGELLWDIQDRGVRCVFGEGESGL